MTYICLQPYADHMAPKALLTESAYHDSLLQGVGGCMCSQGSVCAHAVSH